ncbi:MAG: nucleotidyl transferase AbiEii/AbiGii toxin family protein [Candidatus Woesearchaeota archaeon]
MMLNRQELEKLMPIVGFTTWQMERDYLQHLFLLFLSRRTKGELVFKGGTALQKAFSLNRFSIDLDFTQVKDIDTDSLVKGIASDLKAFGFSTSYSSKKKKMSICYNLQVQGPLYDGRERSLAKLLIEISLREELVLEPEVKEIVPAYPDIQPYLVTVMDIKEMLAEKIRTLVTRNKARDLYDTWFMLKKGVKLDKKLAQKKLDYYGFGYNKEEIKKAIGDYKGIWEKELKLLLQNPPPFDEASEAVVKAV